MAEQAHTPGLNPAVRTALAYTLATGWIPRKIHLKTWLIVNDALEGQPMGRRPKAEFMAAVEADPLAKAHAYLIARGWRVDSHGRQDRSRTSHYIAYSRPDTNDEALACRDGSVCLIKVQDRIPFRQSTGISAAEVARDGTP